MRSTTFLYDPLHPRRNSFKIKSLRSKLFCPSPARLPDPTSTVSASRPFFTKMGSFLAAVAADRGFLLTDPFESSSSFFQRSLRGPLSPPLGTEMFPRSDNFILFLAKVVLVCSFHISALLLTSRVLSPRFAPPIGTLALSRPVFFFFPRRRSLHFLCGPSS